jgi:deoxyribodipyrimidine photo-lyase
MGDRPVIVWFRRDLRLADNPALLHAYRLDAPVLPVYADDRQHGDPWAPGSAGRWWLRQSLERLAERLALLGAPLTSMTGPADEALPTLARSVGAGAVLWNRLWEPFSRDLERRLAGALERDGVEWRSFNAALLFEPEGEVSSTGRPFVQFTPYWRHCRALPEPAPPLPEPRGLRGLAQTHPAEHVAPRAGATEPAAAGDWAPDTRGGDAWQPGEPGARLRLEHFLECCLNGYGSSREMPGSEGTSRLSPHLHFGEIGPRQVWHGVRRAVEQARPRGAGSGIEGARAFGIAPGGSRPGAGPVPGDGGDSFLRQLGWREFAHYILFHFPWIPEQPFRPEFARFPWADDPAGLEAWKRGETGYPLVDAAMRQLLAEGWVHNRARMVAASFLTKDLLIPWQVGAAWYWDRLVDADLANNTLGWQWTAGSGPDAAPYFRVFNPVLQAKRFDADGAYVRRWTGTGPETEAKATLSPTPPIVDHGEARVRALATFRGLRSDRAAKELGSYPLPSDMQV